MNFNRLTDNTDPRVLFIDMNSFFASCEQQVNYYLRGRPVAVCVYTGKHGCVIAPSNEAKKRQVKLGMRLDEAVKTCPDLIPLETNPNRYREFHQKIIGVLKRFSDDVLPKSIDEAVVDLRRFRYVYKTDAAVVQVAHDIKKAIHDDVGDYLKCSIGIAPNVFLAKLGTEIAGRDGLEVITPGTIDGVLEKLRLTDLPGIGRNMAIRLENAGIQTPLQLRHADPRLVRAACQSIVGWHWHLRLNFGGEVDMASTDYRSMQAMRSISKEQRRSVDTLRDILTALCLTLERRMVKQEVFAQLLWVSIRYEEGQRWGEEIALQLPLQDGGRLRELVLNRMEAFRRRHLSGPLLNGLVTQLCVGVTRFIPAEAVQYTLFEDYTREDKLRKTVYSIKDRFGPDKLVRAYQLADSPVWRDVIGFGNVKDMHPEDRVFGKGRQPEASSMDALDVFDEP